MHCQQLQLFDAPPIISGRCQPGGAPVLNDLILNGRIEAYALDAHVEHRQTAFFQSLEFLAGSVSLHEPTAVVQDRNNRLGHPLLHHLSDNLQRCLVSGSR